MTSRKSGRTLASALVALPAVIFVAQDALAAGFAIKEQSGSALGNAFAGSASGTDDISYSYYNAAMMGFLSGNHAAIVGSHIRPDSNFKDGRATTANGTTIGTTSQFNGNKDIGRDATLPAMYLMGSVTEELKLGLAVTLPFGLLTDNEDGWEGRYHALKSDLLTIEINPMVAYRVLPNLSVAGGFRALYADAELSNNIDFATIGQTPFLPGEETDGRAKLQGDDWGFGFTLGLTLEPRKGTRIGVGYRSEVSHTLSGDVDFDLGTGVGSAVSGATGAFVDTVALLPDYVVKRGLPYPTCEDGARRSMRATGAATAAAERAASDVRRGGPREAETVDVVGAQPRAVRSPDRRGRWARDQRCQHR